MTCMQKLILRAEHDRNDEIFHDLTGINDFKITSIQDLASFPSGLNRHSGVIIKGADQLFQSIYRQIAR